MPSLLPVLVHDPDLPAATRAALLAAQAADEPCQEAATRKAAVTLRGLHGLTDPEVADVLGLPRSTFRTPLASIGSC